jgi:hypothetical protein
LHSFSNNNDHLQYGFTKPTAQKNPNPLLHCCWCCIHNQ